MHGVDVAAREIRDARTRYVWKTETILLELGGRDIAELRAAASYKWNQ